MKAGKVAAGSFRPLDGESISKQIVGLSFISLLVLVSVP